MRSTIIGFAVALIATNTFAQCADPWVWSNQHKKCVPPPPSPLPAAEPGELSCPPNSIIGRSGLWHRAGLDRRLCGCWPLSPGWRDDPIQRDDAHTYLLLWVRQHGPLNAVGARRAARTAMRHSSG
jgi:hypothetical protein